jgi:hypothetical protein
MATPCTKELVCSALKRQIVHQQVQLECMNARNAQLVYENTLIKDQITLLMKEKEMRVGFKLQRSISKNQILLMY